MALIAASALPAAARQPRLAVDALGELVAPHSDCNGNGVEDAVDIALGFSSDSDGNGIPDECESGGSIALGPGGASSAE